MNAFLPELNAVCHGLRLPSLIDAWEVLDRADRVILAVSRAFDFQTGSLPNNFRYVGPLLDEPSWARDWARPWSTPASRPKVLVACSTGQQMQQPVFEKIIRSLAGVEVEALATAGPAIELGRIRPPPNVHLVASAPHNAVMEEVSLVVTHGGHGTVSRALLNGLPMLVIPKGRDQHDNAARVEWHGAGLRLSPEASESEIAIALHRLISEPHFRESARSLGQAIEADIAARRFVLEMEEMATRRRTALSGDSRAPTGPLL